MGIAISCPGAAYDSINDSLEAVLNRPIGLGDNVRSTLQSIGFNGRDYCLPAILEAFGIAKSLIKGSFHLEPKISTKSPTLEPDNSTKSDDPEALKFTSLGKRSLESTSIRPDNPKHEAAVKLQKVYKSFRTRRQLADCAVLVEQHWWKLLDFALLKQSSVSFFDIEKPESAMSRWSRATIRAAKAVWPHSGHYRPTEENFQEFMSFLEENSVDLTDVKVQGLESGVCGTTPRNFNSELWSK
ncbi:hypothetical protein BHE74_00011434 [Ensete ventricosum]|nr:hypothetical protein BHE74_00011434 [Ensete ventricosum]